MPPIFCRRNLTTLIVMAFGYMIFPEQASACPSGSETAYIIPIHTTLGTYGIGFAAMILIEALLLQNILDMDLKKVVGVVGLANLAYVVLNCLFATGTFMFWGIFMYAAALYVAFFTVRLLSKDGFFNRHPKGKWPLIGAIFFVSVLVVSYVTMIGHQLQHRGEGWILGTYREYLYYVGMFVWGLAMAIVFKSHVLLRFIKDKQGIYYQLLRANFFSIGAMFALYIFWVSKI